jgi:hypothetical protein
MQTFQSKSKLIALVIHAFIMKVAGWVVFPFKWIADQCNGTSIFAAHLFQPSPKEKRLPDRC